MEQHNAIAIIPARGGSKGIPGKNLCQLAGKSLLQWSIEAAFSAESVERVFVTTDDPSIKQVAQNCGATVVDRPPEISGDFASSEDALLHVLQTLDDLPELTVFLQCTSPLTIADDIDGTVAAMIDADADSAFAAVPFHYFVWEKDEGDRAVGTNHSSDSRLLRQQRKPQYLEAGAVYVMRTRGFLENRHRFFGKTVLYEMPLERRWEIDEPVDFAVAEVLKDWTQSENAANLLPTDLQAIVFDFDGVFTNNKVHVSENGVESVECSRSDGMGIERARDAGLKMLILSKESNKVVAARAEKLKLEVIHGVDEKVSVLDDWLTDQNLQWQQIVYVGNDINDVGCLTRAACGVVVADAKPAAKSAANLTLSRCGGDGAIRELVELILSHRASEKV